MIRPVARVVSAGRVGIFLLIQVVSMDGDIHRFVLQRFAGWLMITRVHRIALGWILALGLI